jgi:hypothetical protein
MTAENIALALWLAFIAVCIPAFYLLSTMWADAAALSMTGSCTGQGFTNITVEADLLVAAINQTVNGTTWQIWGAPA